MTPPHPLRLLHVHHGRILGGAPLSLSRLLTGLDRVSFRSELLLPGEGPAAAHFRALGFPVETIPLAAWYYLAHQPRVKWTTRLKHAALAPWTERALAARLRREPPDIVHLNTALLPLCGSVAARCGVPVLWHIREVVPPDDARAQAFVVEAARRHATRMVAISEAAAAPFRAAGPVTVIPEGVDPAAWQDQAAGDALRAAIEPEVAIPVIVYPAALTAMKGQLEFVEALPRLRAVGEWRVWFVGDPADRRFAARLRGRVGALGLADRVRWLGWRDDMPAVMAASDIVVFAPRREEGFGLALIEAMAAGRPVVTTARGPAAEVVLDGRTGRVVAPEDSAALGEALALLLGSAPDRRRLGAAGRERVLEHYTLDRMCAAFARVFREMAGGAERAPNAV